MNTRHKPNRSINLLMLLLAGVLLFLLLPQVTAFKWNTNYSYDNYTGTTINTSKWLQQSSMADLGSVVYTQTNLLKIKANITSGYCSGGDCEMNYVNVTTKLMPNYTLLHSIEFILNSTSTGDGWNSHAIKPIIFGVPLAEDGNGVKTIKCLRNYTNDINFTCNTTQSSTSVITEVTPSNNITGFMLRGGERANEGAVHFYYIGEIYIVNYTYSNRTMNITLLNPLATPSVNNNVRFNFTLTTSLNSLKNYTLFIDGVQNLTHTYGDYYTTSSLSNPIYLPSGFHNYSVKACDSDDNCKDSETITFAVSSFNITGVSYSPVTSEGSNESYILNFTLDPSETLRTIYFYYDGVRYTPIISSDGNNNYSVIKYNSPLVSGLVDKTFYWEINTTEISFNSQTYQQTVFPFLIDDCSLYPLKIFDLWLKDEETQQYINISQYNTSIQADLQLYSSDMSLNIVNYSKLYLSNNGSICLNTTLSNVSQYKISGHFYYKANDYATEYYYLQQHIISNLSYYTNLTLYDLNATKSKDFLITYKDSNYLPVEDALIFIQRRYSGEGINKNVEVLKTDSYGQAVGHMDRSGVIYSILVIKNGQVLSLFNNIAVYCQDSIINDCKLNLNEQSNSLAFIDFQNKDNLNYNFAFNRTLRRASAYFYTTDFSLTSVTLSVFKYDNNLNVSICNTTLTSSIGSINCDIPASYENITLYVELYQNDNLVTREIYSLASDPKDTFGYDGYYFVFIIILTLVFMSLSSNTGMLISSIIGLVFCIILGFLKAGTIIGQSAWLIFLIIGALILIVKLSARRRDGGLQ